jgi:hypothetical protein
MESIRLRTQNFLLLCLVIFLSGCGGGSGGGSPVATTSVSGSVVAGPVNGAKITVKSAAGTVIAGPVFSGSDGSYTVPVPTSELANDLVFEANSGTFDDEADQTASGKGVPMGTLSAYIAGASLASGSQVTIDPSSTIIRKMVAGGKSKTAAESSFNAAFGYTPDSSVKPAFVNMSTASTDKQRLAGLRIAAFSQLTKDLINDPAKQFELIDALANDMSDDSLNGKNAGVAVSTASGTAIPEDISNRFVAALVNFQTGALNKTKLTADKIGTIPFNKTSLTASYKVEYLPGTIAANQGRTSFKIKLTNRSDGTPATGKTVTLLPFMYMASKSHTTPADAVIEDTATPGTYSCNVYFVMSSTTVSGASMGIWQLKVNIGSEAAYFFPNVAMPPSGITTLTKLTGINDSISTSAGPEKRTYFLFRDNLTTGTGGNYTFDLFLATKESMLSFPAVKVGSQLKDQTGAVWTVNTLTVEVSTDTTTWVNAIDGGNGHWSASGLTGLAAGVAGKIYVKVRVNSEQKTTDGFATGTSYQTFNVIP